MTCPRILMVVRGDPTASTGATERMLLCLRGLARCGDVEVLALTRRNPFIDGSVDLASRSQWVKMHGRRVLPHDYVLALLGWQPRRLLVSQLRRQRREVSQVIDYVPDLVWTFTDRAFLSLPKELIGSTRIVADLIDFEDERDIEQASRSPRWSRLRIWLARADRRALRRTLRYIAKNADRTLISSETDRLRLGAPTVTVLPNGYDPKGCIDNADQRTGEPTFLFAGFLGYGPNLDGVKWLVEDIWPLVLSMIPDAQLRIVGRGLPPELFRDAPGVTVVGEVPSMLPELARASASLVPIRFGSGTRIKILEGWAHRIPVVSTTIGSEGLGAEHKRNLMIADDALSFSRAMATVAQDIALRKQLEQEGYSSWQSRFSPDRIEAEVVEIIRSTLDIADLQ